MSKSHIIVLELSVSLDHDAAAVAHMIKTHLPDVVFESKDVTPVLETNEAE